MLSPSPENQRQGQDAEFNSNSATDHLVQPPSVTLPKGGGAIRGIGEKFSANPVTGTGSMSVPIATSPGRSGFGPQLELSYNLGGGNGPFGMGWNLSLPSITRKTDKGLPRYHDASESDVYILSGAEDLVPVMNDDGTRYEDSATWPDYVVHRYRPRVEGLFARIERWTHKQTSHIHWRSISRDNLTTLYGETAESRVADPVEPGRIFSWLICKSYDDKGNAMVYEYREENDANIDQGQLHELSREPASDRTATRYLHCIKYGNRVSRLVQPDLTNAEWLFEVVFDYDEGRYVDVNPGHPNTEHTFVRASASVPDRNRWAVRPDSFSTHRSGFEVRTYRRCRRVLMFHRFDELHHADHSEPYLVRSTEFEYADFDYTANYTIQDELEHQGSTRFYSFIQSVTQSGYVRQDEIPRVEQNGFRFVTYLKKSLPPLEFEYSKARVQHEVRQLDDESLENLPVGLDGASYRWVDLDGEGISGILTEQGGTWRYKANLGKGRFGPLQTVRSVPSQANLSGGAQQLLDLAGDGQLDLVALSGSTPGFYERTSYAKWESFRTFEQLPNVDWEHPGLRFVDLTGDGHADVLITEDDVFTWYESLAKAGFDEAIKVYQAIQEEQGPRQLFSDLIQSIYLADMCGDGLSDIVRVRNGEVCYWPNLGYGRFGKKVTMDNAPWFDFADQFEHSRIRLADIDGSGTNDIIYLSAQGARLYFNRSGNSWSDPYELDPFPAIDNAALVVTADLFGNGTACLVWSSPLPGVSNPFQYMDLMGEKPHLLINAANNLGTETRIQYASSTQFYLADKERGTPWITRLSFPVHVVERVETYDKISRNRFVTRYEYHHGYFDGEEREFRGFGMVEQFDTEEFAALHGDGQVPTGSNIDASSHVPPVLTKTWFHTGVHMGREHVSDFFAGLLDANDKGEYYREPGLTDGQARALLLEDTVLPGGLTVDEERETCRALRGSMLRQEVYALDGSDKEQHPYRVTEQNFSVRVLQPRGGNPYGVYFTHARESINYNYERNPADPRISHALTLEVDEFGNVLKSAAIGYGRREPDFTLSEADQVKQAQILITYTENRVTNSVETPGDFRSPMFCESRIYELTGISPPADSIRFAFNEILDAASLAFPLDYEKDPTAGKLEKRLIEHERTYYRRDNLAGPLPLGELQSQALPFESLKLAFTQGLIAEVYGGRTENTMFEAEGRYVHTEGDTNWWISSGQIFYSPVTSDTPAQELAYARQHFFLSHRYRDPFHTDVISTESFVTYDTYDLLVQETRDAVGNRITVGERNMDPTQPPVFLRQNYRVLQPSLVMNPNRNRSEVVFDALGLVVGTAVMGKPEESLGDSLTGFKADLNRAEIDQFLASPRGAVAATLLGDATTRIVYDLTAYWREPDTTKKPPSFAATLVRETHMSDIEAGQDTKIQVSFSYSDGFGREIQKKIQAEQGPTPLRDASGKIIVGKYGLPQMTPHDVSPRWVGSGWIVFNNKGNPVRQYEPFFTDTHRFEFDVRIGVSPVLFYDPVERVVATLHSNHTWEKVIFDPWRQETWDVNDTVLLDPKSDALLKGFVLYPDGSSRLPTHEYQPSWHGLRTGAANAAEFAALYPGATDRANETEAARKTEVHAETPTTAHTDSLGRTFLIVAYNRVKYSNTPAVDPPVEESYENRKILDIEGNQREVIDAWGRVVMRFMYNMLGNRIYEASMEAGERWMLNDVAGQERYLWDSREHRIRTAYDQLRRLINSSLSEDGGTEKIVEQRIYGETHPNPEVNNLRGQLVELRDQAGIVISDFYDFKGNLLRSQRQLAELVGPSGSQIPAYRTTVSWHDSVVQLDQEIYISRTRYDALSRPIQLIAPHSDRPGSAINVIQYAYNEANLLDQVDSWFGLNAEPLTLQDPVTADLHAVTNIDYDARGQRIRIAYGNGAATTYKYDPFTFRLVHLLTQRSAGDFPDDCPQLPPEGWSGCQVQNLHYSYDPVGNITHIRDDAQQTIYFRNKRVEPSSVYTYDALYRLIEATGREHLGQIGNAPIAHSYNDAMRIGILHPGDGNAMGRYLERYVYDAVGNFLSMQHRGTDPAHPGWTRTYTYDEESQLEPGTKSNRLTSTAVGIHTETYSNGGDGYDAHGNMQRMSHLQVMQWDFKDQLQMTGRQAVNAEDTDGEERNGEQTWYVYDASGQRVRKVTELSNGQVKDERLYLSGFEIYRRHGTNPLKREVLHIMDDEKRIGIVETRTEGNEPGVPKQLIRFQFGNHLGSAVLELDDRGRTLSYEEYTP